VPREYGHKLPKKVRRAALLSALSQWQQEGSITIVDELESDEYKTRRMVETIKNLGLDGAPLLVVIEDAKPMLEASLRNIPGIGLVRVDGLNVYDVLRHPKMLITRAAVEALQARMTGNAPGGASA
jgi:large subunit ribosomal protein L4